MPRQKIQVEDNETVSESYISIGLGLLVVVVVGILLYNYFTQKNKPAESEKEAAEKIAQEATTSAKPGTVYTVVEGDNLWSISEKSYKSGFNWVDIAKANNITQENMVEVGQQLVIPDASPILPLTATDNNASVSGVTQTPSITGNSYTIAEGDSLWSISCRAYGDCYAWLKIAEANKLENPDLINVGNTLTLPR